MATPGHWNGRDLFLALIFETAPHQHRFHSVFDTSAVAYWELEYSTRQGRHADRSEPEVLPSMRLVDLNQAAEQLFQMTHEEALGSGIGDLWPAASGPDFQVLAAAASEGGRFEMETTLLRKDGSPIDVLLSCVSPQAGNIRATITLAIIDLTEQKARAAAVEALQNDLAHASRVAMLGELTASIAHEVNQPLGAIVNNGSAALRWLNRPEPALDEVR